VDLEQAAMSPAVANDAALWFAVFLTALLAVSLVATVRAPASPDSAPGGETAPAAEAWAAAETGGHGERPPPRHARPESPLPQRTAGPPGRIAPPDAGPVLPPAETSQPRVSGRPPWGPAPKPPGVP
jgi:hypothetical protein